WDSAKAHYEQAVRLDTSFALAHRRLGTVLGWDALEFGRGSPQAAAHRLRAGALRAGLAPRESLLVTADSLFASMTDFTGDSASWRLIERLFSTLEYAARRYPEDPEVWNELGEARFHFGQCVGATNEETRLAFDARRPRSGSPPSAALLDGCPRRLRSRRSTRVCGTA
ncbi:MAG: hypothetical protein AMS18_16295, partial [Gemmatimonas sp. SG8_17]